VSSPYRPEFVAALELLGRACAMLDRQGAPLPILVGGAVVEFDTGGQIVSGDFDFVSAADEDFAAALLEVGFRREDRPGWKRGGFYHPDLPIGIELVSGAYFDGRADRSRVRLVDVRDGVVCMAPTEDLIVDRIEQWEASGKRDPELLLQALTLFYLAGRIDDAYLEARLDGVTGGAFGLAALRSIKP